VNTSSPAPDPILQTAFGFWNSKVLLTAVTFGLFTTLGDRRFTAAELGKELGLHPRGISDFLDALVAMKFLEREDAGADAKYFNTPAGALYLDESSPRYIGGILEMLNARLFRFWNDLPEALRTGRPQNETKHGDKGIFEELYSDPEKLEQFLGGMTGLSRINFEALGKSSTSRATPPFAMSAALQAYSVSKWRKNTRRSIVSALISRRSNRWRKSTSLPPD
jgi:hypothetical protein